MKVSLKNKKVIIVEPAGTAANVFSRYMNLPLMGTLYLGTILRDAGFTVRIYNENFLLRSGGRDKYGITDKHLAGDFLLLSLITPAAERGYEIAKLFKITNPHGKVIIGGVHPTILPDEALLNGADWVVQGEGEEVIVDLLKFGSSEKIIKTNFITDLNKTPIPDFKLLYKSESMDIYPIITSRGCPFNCNFCSVTKTFGHKYRTLDPDRVIYELKGVQKKQIFFYDDNFTANKNRTKEILKKIIDNKIKKIWTAQTRIDVAEDDELLSLMRKSGCIKIYIGLESINDQTLKEYKKAQTRDDIERGLTKIHNAGIDVHGMFIFGSDSDIPDVFNHTVKFCKKNKIETLQYLALTPFPGTDLYIKMEQEGRLLHKNWRYYDALHVVYRPRNITSAELQRKIISSFESFYSFAHTISRAFAAANGLTSSIETFFIRLFARHIIYRWKKVNQGYMRFLLKDV
ncbi:MAG: B12-binding domain-containing radical SAM protein [Oligoflexia bacterium]|nr:B12-binding domain-containing radical SAM protein [Oligoflexia bacterium]